MKTFASLVAFALALATPIEGHAHVGKYHRRGPSATPSAPASSTPTPPTAPVPTSAASKRGVSYNDPDATKGFGKKITWAYNWAQTPGGELDDGVEFIPMLWSNDPSFTGVWADNAAAAIASGSSHLLGFNEPDYSQQANMAPDVAAAAWKTYMEPFAGKAKLCSPAITNGGDPMGTAWLTQFLNDCEDCTIDCIAIHIYDSATNIAYYKSYIQNVISTFGKPVWLTEFGASGTSDDQVAFLNEMIPFLDSLDGLERYAYFMAGADILVDTNNHLTSLGDVYNST